MATAKKAATKKAPAKRSPAKKPTAKKSTAKRSPAKKATARLATYRAKRDFTVTSEPAGSAAPAAGGHRFVVQRHRARRLHYDLRLEADGVLMSWAVPKGPTLDPDVKRMAVHVEDHPLEYFDFEGVIPAGEYGGGDVIVWDWGTWEPPDGEDPVAAVEAGNLHFDLHGEKLKGRFVLVRPGRGDGKEPWLLLHKHD
ncbi:MAG TPA: DNA polymerase ligase N-terminal domain-containing protein, partial [Ilumatobacteraceae bacterium]|nr:DNA polymerase ligase N-terminal domain-containing protein [Ilumatobacteraceae bacterium]